jgi:predicted DNA-binding transcriptional regulator YafY
VARNDQIVRILTVARELARSRRGVSLKALAERHGWAWRTVYRDVAALEQAHFPVQRENGLYRLADGWNTPALPGVDDDEILALYSLRAMAGTVRSTTLGRALDRLWMIREPAEPQLQ